MTPYTLRSVSVRCTCTESTCKERTDRERDDDIPPLDTVEIPVSQKSRNTDWPLGKRRDTHRFLVLTAEHHLSAGDEWAKATT